MENYLMSSPTQLNLDYTDINIDLYNLDVPEHSSREKFDDAHQFHSANNGLMDVNANGFNGLSSYDTDTSNIGNLHHHTNSLDTIDPSTKFYSSKNIALHEPFYDTQFHGYHQQNLAISSTVSVGQDPPSTSKHDGMIGSNSVESIPPLTASISNQSLADSPSSMKRHPQSMLTTPRRLTRNKSMSVGAYNLSTPFRLTSPSHPVSGVGVKVGKKSHSRSLSRSKNLNPFYTPNSFISPKVDSLEQDEFGTPLQTPSTNLTHLSSNQYLSPQIPMLKRQNTLDSIKIEDQDDDAFKQLKRAKSYNSINPNGQFKQLPSSYSSNNIQLLQSQFKKAYPASINLASITKEEKTNGLLPPMASFNREVDSAPTDNNWVHHGGSTNIIIGSNGIPDMSSRHPRVSSAPDSNYGETQNHNVVPPQATNSIIPSFVPDLPIKIKENVADDPKKKHACPLCLARFQRPEHVKRHMKSHSAEKPYECDEPNCGKRFNRKDNLKAHLKKIHRRQL